MNKIGRGSQCRGRGVGPKRFTRFLEKVHEIFQKVREILKKVRDISKRSKDTKGAITLRFYL